MNIPHFSKIRINTIYIDNHILNNLRIITVKIFGYYIGSSDISRDTAVVKREQS